MFGTTIRPALTLALFLSACSSSDSSAPPTGGTGAAAVATVTVSPGTLNLVVGDTARLTATTKDSTGATLTGRAVTWATTNGNLASVSGGLVTATGAGGATITATSEGKSGTSTVAVAVAGGTAVNECAGSHPTWIWCDDFEANRLASYFEYDNDAGRFVRTAGAGVNSSMGMRARWNSLGQVGAGSLHLAFGKTPQAYFVPVDAGTANYRDIYYRVWLRRQAGWTGGGGDKLSRAIIFGSTTNWAQALSAHVWSGGTPGPDQDYLFLDPASGTDVSGVMKSTTYNDFANWRWLGAQRSTIALFSNANAGTWYCLETHIKLNDAGQSNGVFEQWVNGTLDIQKTGLNWVGSYNAYGINAVFVENYWNNGATAVQERYLDQFVVATTRINC